MKREWKPGDVALVEIDGLQVSAMRQAPHEDPLWTTSERCKGGYDHYDSQNRVTVIRPLVVIDPVAITGPDETLDADLSVEIANCLRRLAEGDHSLSYRRRVAERIAEVFDPTPPKPEEPMGDGAVVEDHMGHRWVRIAGPEPERESKPWRHRGHSARTWDHINVVRVLSEGVQP